MRKLIIWDMVTVDGFFEGPDRAISWFVFEEELENYIRETQEKADTLIFGRVTYEFMAARTAGTSRVAAINSSL